MVMLDLRNILQQKLSINPRYVIILQSYKEYSMTKYVKNHTKYILNEIKKNNITETLLDYHRLQIQNIQHERLIHLIVLCLFAFLLISSIVLFFIIKTIPALLLASIFLIVEIFYIRHYYLLENTVQHWYRLENDMILHLKAIGTNTSQPQ